MRAKYRGRDFEMSNTIFCNRLVRLLWSPLTDCSFHDAGPAWVKASTPNFVRSFGRYNSRP